MLNLEEILKSALSGNPLSKYMLKELAYHIFKGQKRPKTETNPYSDDVDCKKCGAPLAAYKTERLGRYRCTVCGKLFR